MSGAFTLQDEYKDAPGQVIASDFYHSNTLMPLSDEDVVLRATRNIAACEPGFKAAKACPLRCPPHYAMYELRRAETAIKAMHFIIVQLYHLTRRLHGIEITWCRYDVHWVRRYVVPTCFHILPSRRLLRWEVVLTTTSRSIAWPRVAQW